MKKNNMINLRREKLKALFLKEMNEFQNEIYNNENLEYMMDEIDKYKNDINNTNPNSKISKNYNMEKITEINPNNYNNSYYNQMNKTLEQKFDNNINVPNNSIYKNQIDGKEPNNNIYQNNIQFNNNYGNIDIDNQINKYNNYYNKLKVDEFMSKKMIQDDLLNKINQRLMKINRDMNDKIYQENLAEQWAKDNLNP